MNTKNVTFKLAASPLYNLGYWLSKACTHRLNALYSTGWEKKEERKSMRMAARHVSRCLKTAKAEGLL
jgi:hypothetical protein